MELSKMDDVKAYLQAVGNDPGETDELMMQERMEVITRPNLEEVRGWDAECK